MDVVRVIDALLCHQIPARSPCCGGVPFPLCHRCAGLQLGVASATLAMIALRAWRWRFPAPAVAVACGLLPLPLAIDGAGNALGLWSTPALARAATGVATGVALPVLLAPLCGPGIDAASGPRLRHPLALAAPAAPALAAACWLDAGAPAAAGTALAWLCLAGLAAILAGAAVAALRLLRTARGPARVPA